MHRTCRRAAIAALVTTGLLWPAAATAQQTASTSGDGDAVTAALTWLGATPGDAEQVAADAFVDGTDDTFRYAVPGSEPATIDEPYGDILRVGGAPVWFAAGFGPDDLEQVPCGTTTADGAVVLCADPDLVDLGAGHWAFVVELGGDVPTGAFDLAQSLAVPLLSDGGTPWEPQGDFLWDTFQGTDTWYEVTRQPGGQFQLTVTSADDFAVVPSGAVAIIRGATLTMLVPEADLGFALPPLDVAALSGDGEGVLGALAAPPDPSVPCGGAHQHTHDGSFGATDSDRSVVDAAPDTNTDERRTPARLLCPGPQPIQLGPPPPTPEEPSEEPTEEPTEASSEPVTADDAPPATDTDPAATGNGAAGLFVAALLGLGAVGTGLYARTRRGGAARTCSCEISVVVTGPHVLKRCCMEMAARLEPMLGDPKGGGPRTLDPSRQMLFLNDADFPGWNLSAHEMVAKVFVKRCSGGAVVELDQASYEWSAIVGAQAIDVTCQVSAPVSCRDAHEHPPVAAADTHHIRLRADACRISVLIENHDVGPPDARVLSPEGLKDYVAGAAVAQATVEHVDVMIECGEYVEIFGFFPNKQGWSLLTGTPGRVDRWSKHTRNENTRGELKSVYDRVGVGEDDQGNDRNMKNYRGEQATTKFTFHVDDCTACKRLRTWWEWLHEHPYPYRIIGQSCVTSAWKSLAEAGIWSTWWGEPISGSELRDAMEALTDAPHEGFSLQMEELP